MRSGYAEVRVERSGNWYLEARGQLAAPGMILTGFNVNGTTQVRLDQFRVWKFAGDLKSPEVKQDFDYKSDTVYEVSGIWARRSKCCWNGIKAPRETSRRSRRWRWRWLSEHPGIELGESSRSAYAASLAGDSKSLF